MDFQMILGLAAPLILNLVTQGIKKVLGTGGYVAMAIVFVIGGISAIIGVGPSPGSEWVDTTINAGWIIGVATFVYNLIKQKSKV